MSRVRPTGVRITLSGTDQVAIEAAADELKHRFAARFAVTGRRRSPVSGKAAKGDLTVWGTLLVDVATDLDASVMDLLDRLYAGQAGAWACQNRQHSVQRAENQRKICLTRHFPSKLSTALGDISVSVRASPPLKPEENASVVSPENDQNPIGFAPKVLALIGLGRSYRLVGRELGLSKNTVADIVKRSRAATSGD